MRIGVLGDEETVEGFRLAGVTDCTVAAEKATDVREQFESMLEEDIGVLVLTDRIAEKIRAKVDAVKNAKRAETIVIEVPDRHGPTKAESTVEGIRRKVLGVKFG